ncbi:signal peptidase I [Gryllotalpicola sp.]|uniref:signal peptidase I n=1 Tax=Gryllotalpicola sp. TaxID=1932787 RepID=UPI002613000C|nr:signal peptidase I [Gryllotalpicola sp.]
MTDTGSVPLPESEAPSVSARRRSRSVGRFLLDILVIFVVALLVSFLIKTFLIRSFYIPSGSMETTLQINDRIIVNELAPTAVPLHRGDVVVFTDPGGWLHGDPSLQKRTSTPLDDFLTFIGLSAADSDNHLVKRVIGLPGDHVVCCTALGQIAVNGVPIKEPYITIPPGEVDAATVRFNVTVPAGELWVMGDNRYNSRDSSLNQDLPGKGFVPESAVVGRAVVISWPLGRWTVLGDYPEVFADVPDAKQK